MSTYITDEQRELNKDRFLDELDMISREGFRKYELIEYLSAKSDFFTAPASTRFHNSFAGGLCDHSLHVYDNMRKLQSVYPQFAGLMDDSIRIVALLHDIAKTNYYIAAAKNVKVYSPTGSKYDSCGRYDWESVMGYTVDDSKRFLYGNHEMTSEFLVRQFVPLSVDESIAILHHHGGMSTDCAKDNITEIYNRNPLATMLHLADMMATYLDEQTFRDMNNEQTSI